MVRIRLRRVGMKNQPSYRIIAADKESPRDGKFLEILGSYNPRTVPFSLNVDEERVYHWLKNGAQPSETVVSLFRQVGLLERWEGFKKDGDLEKALQTSKDYFEKRNKTIKNPGD